MTNEEAIKILEDLPDRIVSMLLPMDKPFDYKQALNLAIKAIKAVTLIKRAIYKNTFPEYLEEDVIDIIKDYYNEE